MTTITATRGLDMIDDELVDRIARTLQDEFGVTDRILERIDQAIAFMHTTAATEEHLWCSVDVDPAWHAFILDTRNYMEYCHQHFGEYLHHHPFVEGDDVGNSIATMKARGFYVDESLWSHARYCI